MPFISVIAGRLSVKKHHGYEYPIEWKGVCTGWFVCPISPRMWARVACDKVNVHFKVYLEGES
jgi:hypothetical protein